MEPNKTEFAERLAAAMQAAGYEPKPAVLEREFNQRYWGKSVTLQGVRRWLRGEVIPPHDKLRTLAEWLNVPPQELGFGDLSEKIERRRKSWEESIGYQERQIFEAFLALPSEQKKIVREVILVFAKVSGVQKE